MSGNHRSGSHRADGGGYRGDGGGYGHGRGGEEPPGRSGSYRDHPADGGRYPHGGSGQYDSGRHRSGQYDAGQYDGGQRRSGQYDAGQYDSGQRRGGRYDSGQYEGGRRRSGEYRSGRYDAGRSTGGRYPRGSSGSHRIVHSRPPRRRLAAVLLGAAAGVAACILAVFLVLGMNEGDKDTGGIANSGATTGEDAPGSGERTIVPDACQTVSDDLAAELAPDADRTQSDTYQASDRQNQCVWGAYTGKHKRVLTVELRAIAGTGGRTGADTAGQTFQTEREADESGKSLLAGHKLTEKRDVQDVGDEAYVIYAVDSAQDSGEAIVNARLGNVLVTVHYSGTDDGKELGADPAIDGATDVAKEAITALGEGG
ncbi:hypothetical protein [Thermomonospora echinospora]|uniref:hypothetical protein n=1 Tax=Thermomonospora echinospora TaxID=1992 RepID=UPI000CDE6AFF|nr:hypothetical protein [Thermomonospora echinospora]